MTARIAVLWIFFDVFYLNFSAEQNYIPLPEENVVWQNSEHYSYYKTSSGSTYIYYFDNDTLINNIRYKKLFSEGVENSTSFPTAHDPIESSDSFPKFYIGAFRQDIANKKVLILFKDSSKEKIVYDFNLLIGDTIKNYLEYDLIVNSIDSLNINGKYHKRYQYSFSGYKGTVQGELIEGIGNSGGFIDAKYSDFYGFSGSSWLDCVTIDGEEVYKSFSYNPSEPCFSPGFTRSKLLPPENWDSDKVDSIEIGESSDELFFNIRNISHRTLTFKIVNTLGQSCSEAKINNSTFVRLRRQNLPSGMCIAVLILNSKKKIISCVKFAN